MNEFDLVIRGGTVIDGTGVPRRRADVAVKDGRVAMISGNIPAGAAKEIDASGCYVAPGAIDLHTHYDATAQLGPLRLPFRLVRRNFPHHRPSAASASPPPAPRTGTSTCA